MCHSILPEAYGAARERQHWRQNTYRGGSGNACRGRCWCSSSYILSQPTPQSLPPFSLDKTLEGLPELFWVEHFVKDKRHGHIVALDQKTVLEEVERQDPIGRYRVMHGRAPKEFIHAEFLLADKCWVSVQESNNRSSSQIQIMERLAIGK